MNVEPIIFGKGWKDIKLGINFSDIEEKLGHPDESQDCDWLSGGLALNYYEDGLQVVINDPNNEIIGIRFYHTTNYNDSIFGSFSNFFTKENVNAQSSVNKIYEIYGKPIKYANQAIGRYYLEYLFYSAGDFWFENSKLVSIGIYAAKSGMSEDELHSLAEYWESKIYKKSYNPQ